MPPFGCSPFALVMSGITIALGIEGFQ